MPSQRYLFLQDVQQSPGVRSVLDEVADRIAGRAVQIANEEGVDVEVTRQNGTRPRGRSYARVSVPAAHEHGDSKTRRIRLLGRAVQGL